MKKIFLTLILAGFLAAAAFTFIIQSRRFDQEMTEKEQNNKEIEGKDAKNKEEAENSRNAIMLAISQQINEISPYETTGTWFPVKVWFDRNDAENRYVYVDYEDGHVMHRMLVESLEVDNGLEFSIIGKFELGEEEWELKEGEDILYGKIFDIYNWNPDNNQAEKVN